LEFNNEPLVSSDYKGNSHSCIIDGLSTMVMANRMVKVMGWYDNEWGYSCRTADLAAMMAEKGI
jgi:glyceraldehyde 3-phosphate dehydrogenase